MGKKKREILVQFNKKIILETAEKLFLEKGIKQTTMDDISKAADYSKSTIYVYFKSKEEIYNHIIYDHMCELRDVTNQCIKEATNFEECYYTICNKLFLLYEQYPLYFSSIMGNISIDEKALAENEILQQIYDIGEEIANSMTLLFERGISENYLSSDISILPSVFTLWASLGSLITMSNEKESYILKRMNMKKSEFLQHGFQMLFHSIKRR
ncbi:MAG: TetR/AcrR family transcriptional regulator [Lachnospiraceae bacterium]|nr:TetR/AcrR family transcriptional regulator [Lachnospiraceae bacterium]